MRYRLSDCMGRDGGLARGVIESITQGSTPRDVTGERQRASGCATLALAETCGTKTGI
ncbi:MAG: hypothetical protein ACYDHG_15570 [Desulfomonilaceae bacterium]